MGFFFFFYKTALLFEINPRADLFKSETCHTVTCCTASGSEVQTVGWKLVKGYWEAVFPSLYTTSTASAVLEKKQNETDFLLFVDTHFQVVKALATSGIWAKPIQQ